MTIAPASVTADVGGQIRLVAELGAADVVRGAVLPDRRRHRERLRSAQPARVRRQRLRLLDARVRGGPQRIRTSDRRRRVQCDTTRGQDRTPSCLLTCNPPRSSSTAPPASIGRATCKALAALGVPFSVAGRRPTALEAIANGAAVRDRDARRSGRARACVHRRARRHQCRRPAARVGRARAHRGHRRRRELRRCRRRAGRRTRPARAPRVGGAPRRPRRPARRRARLRARRSRGIVGRAPARRAMSIVDGLRRGGAQRARASGSREDRPLDEVVHELRVRSTSRCPRAASARCSRDRRTPAIWRRDRWEAGARRRAPPDQRGRRVRRRTRCARLRRRRRHHGPAPRRRGARRELSCRRRAAPAATRALRLLARALPLVPKRRERPARTVRRRPTRTTRARGSRSSRRCRRGFAAAQIVVRGARPYRTTGAIAAWSAHALADARRRARSACARPASCFAPSPRCARSRNARRSHDRAELRLSA